jgi:hypothetical protein
LNIASAGRRWANGPDDAHTADDADTTDATDTADAKNPGLRNVPEPGALPA